MVRDHKLRLLIENLAEQRIIEGIFRDEVERGLIQVQRCWESSSAISVAQSSLLQRPDEPVALVLNTHIVDPVEIEEEWRGPVLRLLSETATQDWHAAFAIPRLDAWAVADPRIKRAFGEDESKLGPRTYYDRAVRFADLTKREPFDRGALYRSNAEFRGLADFIQRQLASAHAPVDAS